MTHFQRGAHHFLVTTTRATGRQEPGGHRRRCSECELILLVVTAAATTVLPAIPADAQAVGGLRVRVVDVGQGDGVLYQGPCGELGLVDTPSGADEEVLAAMDQLGTRRLEWVNVSHYDLDHVGGIVGVATAPEVTVVHAFDRGGVAPARYADWADSDATRRVAVDIGFTFSLCDGDERVSFTVVSAGTDGTAAAEKTVSEENDRSVCLHVRHGDFDLATCGDVNGTDEGSRADVETAVTPSYGDLEVAKVNHHGSRFSSNAAYVETLQAQASFVSVGANSFGHPTAEALDRWDAVGDVYQTGNEDGTMHDGSVTISTGGTSSFTATTSASGSVQTYPMDSRDGGPLPADSPIPDPPPPPDPISTSIVVNEVQTRGTTGPSDEFIELRNISGGPLDVSGWQVEQCDGTSGATSLRARVRGGTVLAPGQHYLLTNGGSTARPTDGVYSGGVPGDQMYVTGLVDGAGVRVVDAEATVVDRVGFSAVNTCVEGSPAPAKDGFPAQNDPTAVSRDEVGADTGDNAADFRLRLATPTNGAGLGLPAAAGSEVTR